MTKYQGDEIESVTSTTSVSNTTVEQLQDGGWVVSWLTRASYYDATMQVQRYDSDGVKIGGTLTFDPLQNFVWTTLSDGGWLVQGTDVSTGEAIETLLRFDDEGNPVALDDAMDTDFERILGLPDGGWVGVSRIDLGNGEQQMVQQRYDDHGEAVGSPVILTSGPYYAIRNWDLTQLENGGWLTTWSSSDGAVSQQRFTSDGLASGPVVELYPQWVETLAVGALTNGGWIAVIEDFSKYTVSVLRHDENGQQVGDAMTIARPDNTFQESWAVLGLDDGGWVVAWRQGAGNDYAIRARVYDASGVASAHDYIVENAAGTDIALETTGDGGFAITWQGSWTDGIRQRVFHIADNTAPVAVDDIASANEGETFILDPPGNDQDADSDDYLTLESAKVLTGAADVSIGEDGKLHVTDKSLSLLDGETTTLVIEYTTTDGFDTDTGQITVTIAGRASDGDVIEGTSKADRFKGSNFDETFLGRAGNDNIYGDNGRDFLIGEAGRDFIRGGAGYDTLVGGKGDDKLVGGPGADTFIFAPGDGRDIIGRDTRTGYEDDILDLTSFGFRNFNQVRRLAHADGPDLIIDLPGKDKITIIDYLEHNMLFAI